MPLSAMRSEISRPRGPHDSAKGLAAHRPADEKDRDAARDGAGPGNDRALDRSEGRRRGDDECAQGHRGESGDDEENDEQGVSAGEGCERLHPVGQGFQHSHEELRFATPEPGRRRRSEEARSRAISVVFTRIFRGPRETGSQVAQVCGSFGVEEIF